MALMNIMSMGSAGSGVCYGLRWGLFLDEMKGIVSALE